MSKVTANAATRFVTAYTSAEKSSVKMVAACVDILTDNTPATALVAAVRGAFESKNGAFTNDKERKAFETLVSQRSFAAQLIRIVGDDAATDEVAIKAALRVASGALPRKTALAIADAHKGTDDAPAFAAAIAAALEAKKATPRGATNMGGTNTQSNEVTPAPAPLDSFKSVLNALDELIRAESDPKVRNEYRKALQVRMVRLSNPVPVAA